MAGRVKETALCPYTGTTYYCIRGDGACLFRCVSMLLYNTQNFHGRVRKDMLGYAVECKEVTMLWWPEQNRQFLSKEEYSVVMGRQNTYGGQNELQFMSELKEFSFVWFTVKPDEAGVVGVEISFSRFVPGKKLLLLRCSNGENNLSTHFDLYTEVPSHFTWLLAQAGLDGAGLGGVRPSVSPSPSDGSISGGGRRGRKRAATDSPGDDTFVTPSPSKGRGRRGSCGNSSGGGFVERGGQSSGERPAAPAKSRGRGRGITQESPNSKSGNRDVIKRSLVFDSDGDSDGIGSDVEESEDVIPDSCLVVPPGTKGVFAIYSDDVCDDLVEVASSSGCSTCSESDTTSSSDTSSNASSCSDSDSSDDEICGVPVSVPVPVPVVVRPKPWVALPQTYHSKPTLRLRSDNGKSATYMSAAVYGDEDWTQLKVQRLPGMTYTCSECGAKFRPTEIGDVAYNGHRSSREMRYNPDLKTGLCCNFGRVKISDDGVFKEPSAEIKSLYTGEHPKSENFKKNILPYNRMFSTVQFVYKKTKLPRRTAMEVLNVNGKVMYTPNSFIGDTLEPGQIYFVEDDNTAVDLRLATVTQGVSDIDREIVVMLQEYLLANNGFVKCFKTAREIWLEEQIRAARLNTKPREVTLAVNRRPAERSGYRVAMETVQERMLRNSEDTIRECKDFLAAVLIGDFGDVRYDTKFVPRPMGDGEQFPRLLGCECTVDVQSYPLIHLHAEKSWSDTDGNNKTNSLMEYYKYRIMRRDEHKTGVFNPLFQSGKLFSQYLLDGAIKIESSLLDFYTANQMLLKACKYKVLRDWVSKEAKDMDKGVGKFIVLPKAFKHGPRCMKGRFLDGMALARELGCPSYFVTMTCNPKWAEISEEYLRPGVTWQEFPDIVVRVFKDKYRHMMSDIVEKQVLGRVTGYFTTDEFQKGSLPHSHILIIIHPDDRPLTPEQVDRVISAELPPEDHPAFPFVVEHMLHHRCDSWDRPGSPGCFADGKRCRFRFPKKHREYTDLNGRRVEYRRRRNRKAFIKNNKKYNNRNVVPHNIYLLMRYNCHINVEFCKSTLQSFKYLCSYVNKSADRAYVSLIEKNKVSKDKNLEWDEIEHYREMRYLCPTEAVYRVLGFRMGDISHSIVSMPVHLEGEQTVVFNPGQEAQAAEEERQSMLIAWFSYNREKEEKLQALMARDPTYSPTDEDTLHRRLFYGDFPSKFIWDKKNKSWIRRQRGTAVGRLSIVAPTDLNMEKFYLRLLLLNVAGATSYDSLRTVNGVTFATFKDACLQLGLLKDDEHALNAMTEIAQEARPSALRYHFCMILKYCCLEVPLGLWKEFADAMSEDFAYRCRDEDNKYEVTDVHRNMALLNIQAILHGMDRTLKDYGLGEVDEELVNNFQPNDDSPLLDEVVFLKEEADAQAASLTPDQRTIYDYIIKRITEDDGDVDEEELNEVNNLFLILGSGGTGKTYLYNAILTYLIAYKIPVASCAYTGIAAMLLHNGITSHRLFGLPVNPDPRCVPCSTIDTDSAKADKLRDAKVFIWDEISMASAWEIDVADKFLRQLMKDDRPFGGKIVIFGGDFKQTLPIVKKGHRLDIVAASFISSPLWESLQVLELTKNVRAAEDEAYADWLATVGDGSANLHGTSRIDIPKKHFQPNLGDLIDAVFGTGAPKPDSNAVILTPRNDTMREVNGLVYDRLPGDGGTYLSTNEFYKDKKAVHDAGAGDVLVTQEMLQDLEDANLAPHRLQVKPGCVVMLLCNLQIQSGLCNGTRLEVLELKPNTIKCKILTGPKTGNIVWLFRVKICRDSCELPGTLVRTQYPIRLAYCVTINKSQGSTYDRVGLFLPTPCFGHGQFYTGTSRGKHSDRVFICVRSGSEQGYYRREGTVHHFWTRNEVYGEIIHDVKCHPRRLNLEHIRAELNLFG